MACIVDFIYMPQKYAIGSNGIVKYPVLMIAYRETRNSYSYERLY